RSMIRIGIVIIGLVARLGVDVAGMAGRLDLAVQASDHEVALARRVLLGGLGDAPGVAGQGAVRGHVETEQPLPDAGVELPLRIVAGISGAVARVRGVDHRELILHRAGNDRLRRAALDGTRRGEQHVTGRLGPRGVLDGQNVPWANLRDAEDGSEAMALHDGVVKPGGAREAPAQPGGEVGRSVAVSLHHQVGDEGTADAAVPSFGGAVHPAPGDDRRSRGVEVGFRSDAGDQPPGPLEEAGVCRRLAWAAGERKNEKGKQRGCYETTNREAAEGHVLVSWRTVEIYL